MSKEELNKREKHIRYNFASIFLLMSAIAIGAIAGVAYIVMLLL